MGRIEASKPAVAPKVERASIEPAKAQVAAPAAAPTKSTGTGFEPLKKKLMSVSGRYTAHKPATADRADLKQFVSGQRLAQQAGNSSPQLSQAIANGPAANPSGAIAQVIAGVEGKQMKATTLDTLTKPFEGLSPADADAQAGKLSPGPKGDRAQLEAAVKKGTVKDPKVVAALLNSAMTTTDQLALLKGLPKETLKALSPAIRLGTIKLQPNVVVSMGIEMAARTKWGAANPKIVDQLRTSHADGKITVGLKAGLGATEDGKIRLNADLLKSPEAMASIVAHEGTHLLQKNPKPTLEDEVQGNVSGAAVWGEIGSNLDVAVASHLEQLNGYANLLKTGGADAVRTRVATAYIKDAEQHVAERKAESPPKTHAADDTAEAWQAKADGFRKELAEAEAAKKKKK